MDDLSVTLAAGQSWFWHRRAGVGKAARLLVVAGPHRVLVDDGTQQSCRRNQMGDVVRRWKVLSGEFFILLQVHLNLNWMMGLARRPA